MPDLDREHFFFERLKLAVPELADANVIRQESPDFVACLGDQQVGIELTEFHSPTMNGARPASEISELRRRIVYRAQTMHANLGGDALYLKCAFRDGYALRKRDVEGHATLLASSVLRSMQMSVSAVWPTSVPWNELPEFAAKIWFRPSVSGNDALWNPVEAGWVRQIGSQDIADVVDRKSRKVRDYRSACDSVWLVIVHYSGMREFSELSAEAASSRYRSEFDRVLWLDPLVPSVNELPLTAQ